MDHKILRSRSTTTWVALALSMTVSLAGLVSTGPGAAARGVPASDHASGTALARAPQYERDRASRDTERGIRFRPATRSSVTALRYYRVRGDTGRHAARVWSDSGKSLGKLVIPSSGEVGWQKASFASPVELEAGSTYAASFSVRAGVPYAVLRDATAGGGPSYSVLGGARALKGLFPVKVMKRSQFLVRPVLTKVTTKAPSSFPDAANTGVPGGVSLSAYTGASTVRTDGAVIDRKQVDGSLSIQAENVVIKHSHVDGNIEITEGGSLTISDSTVDGGTFDGSAVGQYNVTMRRVEVVGARQSISCNQNCDIQDSWLHAQYIRPGSDWHGDGFVSNGGSDMLVRHNTLACDSQTSGDGGCSGAVALFADFDAIADVTIDANLFTAGAAAYCLYGGYDPGKPYGRRPTNVVITSNVFQRGENGKCAAFGAAAAVADSGEGNVFEGNVWDDGKKVRQP